MPQLDPTWFASQLFWLVVMLVAIFVVCSKVILPPLLAVLELRTSKRQGDLSDAERFQAEAEAMKEEYERTLADTRTKAQQLFADAEEQNKRAAETALNALNVKLAEGMAEAESRIKQAQKNAHKELEPLAAKLAVQVTQKLVDSKPDESKAKAAVQKAMQSH